MECSNIGLAIKSKSDHLNEEWMCKTFKAIYSTYVTILQEFFEATIGSTIAMRMVSKPSARSRSAWAAKLSRASHSTHSLQQKCEMTLNFELNGSGCLNYLTGSQ